MLVDDKKTLENIFKNSKMLIAVHYEDEETIKKIRRKQFLNLEKTYQLASIRNKKRGSVLQIIIHAVDLAKKYNTRLHVFHINRKRIRLFKIM